MKRIVAFFFFVLFFPCALFARQHSEDDFGRMLIQSVLQAGSNALQQYAEEEDGSSSQSALPNQRDDVQASPSLQSLFGGTMVEAWKEELKTEFADYAERVSDKAAKSVLKRLDRDGEIRASLQKNMQTLEVLAWCLVAYLFVVTLTLLIGISKIKRTNKRLMIEIRSLQSMAEALNKKN